MISVKMKDAKKLFQNIDSANWELAIWDATLLKAMHI
jgi:hypothetical protein